MITALSVMCLPNTALHGSMISLYSALRSLFIHWIILTFFKIPSQPPPQVTYQQLKAPGYVENNGIPGVQTRVCFEPLQLRHTAVDASTNSHLHSIWSRSSLAFTNHFPVENRHTRLSVAMLNVHRTIPLPLRRTIPISVHRIIPVPFFRTFLGLFDGIFSKISAHM